MIPYKYFKYYNCDVNNIAASPQIKGVRALTVTQNVCALLSCDLNDRWSVHPLPRGAAADDDEV